jgi:hypothetical protein
LSFCQLCRRLAFVILFSLTFRRHLWDSIRKHRRDTFKKSNKMRQTTHRLTDHRPSRLIYSGQRGGPVG